MLALLDGLHVLGFVTGSERSREQLIRNVALMGTRPAAAMNALIFERLTLESHLRHALERNELMVYYQPRVSIGTGEIVSVEALLRWKHPELGMVSPAQFIPVAEESGLILPIGEWVLREACAQSRRWRDAGLPAVGMSVNLSSAQFREADLLGVVQRAQHFLGRDGQILHAHADRVVNRIRDSCLHRQRPRLADPFRAERPVVVGDFDADGDELRGQVLQRRELVLQ